MPTAPVPSRSPWTPPGRCRRRSRRRSPRARARPRNSARPSRCRSKRKPVRQHRSVVPAQAGTHIPATGRCGTMGPRLRGEDKGDRASLMFPPERIVCLTEETVETLYLLGEERRIVGVSGYAVRPARVRKEKPRVSAFISADIEKILALKPDLVLTFSDLQADIAAELIRRNIAVHAFNQRDVAGIFAMIRTLGALVGATEKAEALAASLEDRLDEVREQAEQLP